jgi:hypothetical protein
MVTAEKKKKLLKAKIAVALNDELGRVPKKEEIEQVFLLARGHCSLIAGGCASSPGAPTDTAAGSTVLSGVGTPSTP